VKDCAVSPDGTWIVSGAETPKNYTLTIWDVATGSERATLNGHTNRVEGCAVSPDGTWIVSASADHTLKIWDAASGSERATLTDTDEVGGCAVSPDGTWIVSVGDTVKIWDVASGSERAVLVLPGWATAVAFHPFAPMVAYGEAGGGVYLAHVVGIDLGPLVVTAAVRGDELAVRCPACREAFPLDRDRLGTETACPRPACAGRLRVNPFVLRPLPRRPRVRRWFRRR
jgi:WD40 repeat protein